jgi:CRISPR system Cascade subunit CasD
VSATLLLLLKGPMQSWGYTSRYRDRATGSYPTKSGIVGMLAAAEGRRRSDSIEDLAQLHFAVRVDQPGSLLHDYQTAQPWQTGGNTALVSRYYLTDAVFLAAVESPDRELLEGISQSLCSPRFPLFLGRRSCPANIDLVQGVHDGDAVSTLRSAPWFAAESHRRSRPQTLSLPIFRDARPGEAGDPRQDVPISFDQAHRRYGWRNVVQDEKGAQVENSLGTRKADPFFEEVISA